MDVDLLVDFSVQNWGCLLVALRRLNASVTPFCELSPERRYHARLDFYPTVEFMTGPLKWRIV